MFLDVYRACLVDLLSSMFRIGLRQNDRYMHCSLFAQNNLKDGHILFSSSIIRSHYYWIFITRYNTYPKLDM